MKMTNWLCAVGMMGLVACGGTVAGVTQKTSDAVAAAVSATCGHYNTCGKIGSGSDAKYPDSSTCTTQETSTWAGRWSASDCDGKISTTNLNTCTDAIGKVDCGSTTDLFVAVNDQCAESKVCSGK